MLKRIQEHIYTEHNQFGFKQKHGTDLCNMVLKEAIRSYKSKGSSVFVCFMDASKAFDRVNHKQDCQGFDNDPALVYSLRYFSTCTCVTFL